jgi:type III pantothenate kinase
MIMMLCVDIGNTSTVIGVLDGTRVIHFWRIMTAERSSDEYALLVASLLERSGPAARKPDLAGICSVVPSETTPVAEALRSHLAIPAKIVEGNREYGVRLMTDNPSEVGADRIANAVAAFYEYGAPAIIVDIGTATTYDYLARGGRYRGGAIAPGMLAGAKDLWQRARMLPAVEIKRPATVIGTSTVRCMQSGIFYGNVGQIEGVVKRMWDEIGGTCRVIMTGGWAAILWKHLCFETVLDRDLTLKGIAYAVDPGLRKTGRGRATASGSRTPGRKRG